LIGATITFIISGILMIYQNYFLLILIRFFSGIFEGNSSISLAMINDLEFSAENKMKWFGKINVSLTIGYLVGPLLGSFFSNKTYCSWLGFSVPFFVSALIYFLTFLIVRYYFIETLNSPRLDNSDFRYLTILKTTLSNSYYFIVKSSLRGILFATLFITSTVDIIYQFIPIYLVAHWNAQAMTLALGVLLLSAGKIIGGGYLNNFLYTFLKSETKSILLILFILFFLLTGLMLLDNQTLFLLLLIAIGICISILITNCMALISNHSASHEQGIVLGAAQSQRALGSIILCNIASLSCALSFNIPFMICFLFIITGSSLLWIYMLRDKNLVTSMES
jgi:DHA1 family tetracycline resistance protein-like MFS transporter